MVPSLADVHCMWEIIMRPHPQCLCLCVHGNHSTPNTRELSVRRPYCKPAMTGDDQYHSVVITDRAGSINAESLQHGAMCFSLEKRVT